MSTRFDAHDLAVYQAHSLADGQAAGDGQVTTRELQDHHHGPLPRQRLTGMQRRGLLKFNGAYWTTTPDGIAAAERYRSELRRRPTPARSEEPTHVHH